MLLKLAGAVLTVGACGGIGHYFVRLLTARVWELTELYHRVSELQGEIRYTGTPLSEAFLAAGNGNGRFQRLCLRVAEELDKGSGEVFAGVLRWVAEEEFAGSTITRADKEALYRLGDSLGRLDKQQQLSAIEYYLNGLAEEIGEAKRLRKERGYLYQVLGVLAGLFLTILLL